jgi:hypothetical protein
VGLTENGIRFLNTPWAVIGGLVYGYVAFMILPIYGALDRLDPALIEAGKDLYGSRWQTFRHVTWPTTFRGVLAGVVLVFLPAVGDFVSAQLLGGPDTFMVGNLIQQQFFGAENWPFGAALTTVMMLFLLVCMVFYLRSAERRRARARRRQYERRGPASHRGRAAGEGARPPPRAARPRARGRRPGVPHRVHRALLCLPVPADRGRRPVLVQRGALAAGARRVQLPLVRHVLLERVVPLVASGEHRDRARDDGRGDDPGNDARVRPRPQPRAIEQLVQRPDARAARDAGDRRGRLGAAPVHAAGAAPVARDRSCSRTSRSRSPT